MSKKLPSLGVLGPSPEDKRDYKYQNRLRAKSVSIEKTDFPSKFLLVDSLLKPRNQGSIGSCAAQTAACVVEALNFEQYGTRDYMSPSFVYGLRYTRPDDAGMYMRNVCKILHAVGMVKEETLSYQFAPTCQIADPWRDGWDEETLGKIPNIKEAQSYKIGEYRSVAQDVQEMKAALHSEKAPLMIAVPVYIRHSEDTYRNRMWKYEKGDKNAGGHAMAMVGWDDDVVAYDGCQPGAFLIRNSWGTSWGESGYTWFPYEDLMTKREADIENYSEHPNMPYPVATPMPWEIWAVIDAADIVPDPEPEPEPEPESNSKQSITGWIVAAIALGLPILLLIAYALMR